MWDLISRHYVSIGDYAFYKRSSLTSIDVPDGVTSIGGSTFDGCTNLASVNIPNSVTSIEEDAFYKVPHITYHGTATGSPWGALSMN